MEDENHVKEPRGVTWKAPNDGSSSSMGNSGASGFGGFYGYLGRTNNLHTELSAYQVGLSRLAYSERRKSVCRSSCQARRFVEESFGSSRSSPAGLEFPYFS
ncbi:hypothetical protein RJT34_28091 [Clitoria ternatea]|uniref:Uncharacterized protein n=1 Tax=Clitoria ternatea TaxID=43366 RepID=A0AAN9I8U5_CLITE